MSPIDLAVMPQASTASPAAPAPARTAGAAQVPALAGGGLGAMQAQLTTLEVQLAGLKAQWSGLQSQLNSMRLDNPARAPVQQQAADVGVEIAKVEGNIASLEAQIRALHARPATIETPPPYARNGPTPAILAVGMSFALLIVMAIPLSIAMARRLWRNGRSSPVPASDESAQRLARLEHAVDAIAIEVERISEGQRFMTKIMAERPRAAAGGADQNGSAPLALGAGPAEPVRAAERDGAKIGTPRA